jgi:hypothetical protein
MVDEVTLGEDPQPVTGPEDDNAEPEGVIVAEGGKRLVDVSVLAAERRRVREATTRQKDQELTTLREQHDRVSQALNEARPYVDIVKQHPELLKPAQPTSLEQSITDDEASQEARDLQLYKADGTLDLSTSKKIIARRRNETQQAASAAAREAVAPLQAATAEDRSRQHFARMCQLRDADDKPLVDPKVLAAEWVKLPADLTQDPQVAETVLDAAIGRMIRSGKRVSPSERQPVYSEAPGGRTTQTVQLTDSARKLGLTQEDMKTASKNFNPNGVSVIGG